MFKKTILAVKHEDNAVGSVQPQLRITRAKEYKENFEKSLGLIVVLSSLKINEFIICQNLFCT